MGWSYYASNAMNKFTKNKLFVYDLDPDWGGVIKASTSGYCNMALDFIFIEDYNIFVSNRCTNILKSLNALKAIILNGLSDSDITFKVNDYKISSNKVNFLSLVEVGKHTIYMYESTIKDTQSIDGALIIFKNEMLEDFNSRFSIFKYDLNYMQDLNELIAVFTEAAEKENVKWN